MISAIFSNNSVYFYYSKDELTQTFEGRFDLNDEVLNDKLKDKLRELKTLSSSTEQAATLVIVAPLQNKYAERIADLEFFCQELQLEAEISHIPLYLSVLWSEITDGDTPVIILSSLETDGSVYYHLPGTKQNGRNVKLKQAGHGPLAESLKKFYIQDLKELGVELDESDINMDVLVEKLTESRKEFSIKKFGQVTNLILNFKIEDQLTDNIYKSNNQFLKNYLSPEILQENIDTRIILLGSYFNNAKTKDFLQAHLAEAAVEFVEHYSMDEIYSNIARGSFKMAYFQQDGLKREKLALEKEKLAERSVFIEQVRNAVSDPNQFQEYLDTFAVRGEELGIPTEVLSWHINTELESQRVRDELQEISDSLEKVKLPNTISEQLENTEEIGDNSEEKSVESIGETSDDFSIIIDDDDHEDDSEKSNDSVIQAELVDDEPKPAATENTISFEEFLDQAGNHDGLHSDQNEEKIEEALEAFQVSDFSSDFEDTGDVVQLESIIETERIFPNGEFILLKGKIKASKVDRIFRIISTNELADISNLQNFRRIYEREFNYYDEVSQVFRSNFGLFYYRNFIDGTTLDEYIKLTGLDSKTSIQDFDSNDLKLIFHLWKEVKTLPFSFDNFDPSNILVIKIMAYNSKTTLGTKFVGIRSDISTKEAMEQRLHDILHASLIPGVYDNFLAKFK